MANVYRTLAQRGGRVGYSGLTDQKLVANAKKNRKAAGGDSPPKQPAPANKVGGKK